ncbi:hypothetical protein ACLB1G_21735 [Oxalobacteraceae bacterium A2-2]|jgi:hypothetical protein
MTEFPDYEADVKKDPAATRKAWLSIILIEGSLLAALIWNWW